MSGADDLNHYWLGRSDDDIGELSQQGDDKCRALYVQVFEQLGVAQDTRLLEVLPGGDDHPGWHELRTGSSAL